MKIIKKLLILNLTIILFFNLLNSSILHLNASDITDNGLYSLSAVLIDGDTGRVLYNKNGLEIRPMASTTKIMTLIIALEYGNREDVVTVSSYASKMPDVQLNIKEGEQYLLNDLFYSLMLESHNDVAVAIAEHIGGSVNAFSDMMNKKAKEIGLSNTYFITPNGLDASDEKGVHSTTATDLARLMKYCVMESPKKDEFIHICQTRNYNFSDYENKRNFSVSNKNLLFDKMDGVIAGKTGFTANAGYCYVAAVERDNKTYIVALLGCGWPNNKNYKWSDTIKLMNYGIDNYDMTEIVNNSTNMKTIEIIDGIGESYIETYINDNVNFITSSEDVIKLEYVLPDKIIAPVNEGDVVGYLNVIVNGDKFRTVNIYSSKSVLKKDLLYYFNLLLNQFL